ncbi:MAG: ABC transporter substrate-binding protein [Planctomycetota bacterium]
MSGAGIRARSSTLLLLGLVLLTAACGEDAPSRTQGGAGPVETVVLGFQSGPDTFDPVAWRSERARRLFGETVSLSLVRYRPDLETHEPWLAATPPEETSPGRWRWTLRAGARFSDGRPLTAEDVVATADFVRAHAAAAPRAATALVGVSELLALDATRFELAFAGSRSALLDGFGREFIVLHPDARVDEAAARIAAPGFGPYRMVERRPDEIRFERVARWWGNEEDAFRGRFGAARLAWRIVPDESAAPRLLEAGSLHFAGLSPERAAALDDARITVAGFEARAFSYLGFNARGGVPTANAAVRRALAGLVPRDRIAAAETCGAVRAVRAPFGLAASRLPTTTEALAALDAHGLGDADGDGRRDFHGEPWSLRLLVPAGRIDWVDRVVIPWREALRGAGIGLTPVPLELPEMVRALRGGDFDAFLLVWRVTESRPSFRGMLHSTARGTGGNNFQDWAEIDGLVETLERAEGEELAEARRRFDETILREAPVSFLFAHRAFVAWRRDLIRLESGPFGPDLTTLAPR